MKNTSYSQYATDVRFLFLTDYGLDSRLLAKHKIGPVLLKEELSYFKELKVSQPFIVTCEILRSSRDFKKFAFEQKLLKNGGTTAAKIVVEGLWLDLVKRRPMAPPPDLAVICEQLPRKEDFHWIE